MSYYTKSSIIRLLSLSSASVTYLHHYYYYYCSDKSIWVVPNLYTQNMETSWQPVSREKWHQLFAHPASHRWLLTKKNNSGVDSSFFLPPPPGFLLNNYTFIWLHDFQWLHSVLLDHRFIRFWWARDGKLDRVGKSFGLVHANFPLSLMYLL